MNDTFDIENAIVRVQNKIKRTQRPVYVYFMKGNLAATVSPDDKLIKKLIGVYDSSKKTYKDTYIDEDIRWATRMMTS